MQQIYEQDLNKTTCKIDLFHTLLQNLILGMHSEVDYIIEELDTDNIFEFPDKDLCYSTDISICCLSNNNGYFRFVTVITNPD